ncbi:ABC transporter substrate-binding protein [Sinomonas atrocyanea]|uniref:ABC transporter substrate-binding protein n=1 Tax=Sinomonas atrocyanea TaxID=37927 RepID=UPI00278B2FAF|nr:ABC transporter substrate-binding protein [Sinomonas atrocyanea]MDQ0260741.1 hypothetical protein [Sinomonas atrocyanea]MDR6622276.1 hypothetical protein [Sinomonas atrocyanea]
MAQSIDVGTVLGGRYKVTSSIVTSHESDLVLDGVDQVLNRPVSILVAGPSNADQLAQSAREVAMGERHGSVQVLDLGISHGSTYLITNHTSPADLLDLIVPQETPYVEPFFTDTLGSEIFGESRSREPETYDGMVDPGRPDQYIRYDDYGQPEHHEGEDAHGGAAGAAAAGGAAGAAAAAAAARRQHQQYEQGGFPPPQARPEQQPPRTAQGPAAAPGSVPPPPQAPPRSGGGPSSSADAATQSFRSAAVPGAAAAGAGAAGAGATGAGAEPASEAASPKVSPWSPGDRDASAGTPTAPAPQQKPAPQPQQRHHEPSAGAAPFLPAAVRPSSSAPRVADYEDDDEATRPRSMPWLVGGVLAVVLIAALIFAFTTLGGLFQPQQGGTANSTSQPSQQPTASQETTASASAAPTAPTAPPAIDSVTRLNPEDLSFANSFDSRLPLTFDGNTATYWSDMEFAREDWGGFTKSVALSVKLANPAQVKQVTLIQSGGSGGNLSIYTNSQPSLSGATLAGTTSFTGPQVSVPVSGTPTAQYVIIQINALPRLSAPKTQYPYGLRLAEIKVE